MVRKVDLLQNETADISIEVCAEELPNANEGVLRLRHGLLARSSIRSRRARMS